MSTDSLIVTTPTGVDVQLAIAGPGSRSYAFIIDWHIRLLLALTWFAIGALLANGVIRAKVSGSIVAVAVWPALGIYLLYHPLLEIAMRGRTPGKRMAGVRLVDRQGGTPSTLALLIRNAFRLIDSLPALYGVGLCVAIFNAERLRLGDIAAGTLLVHDGDTESKALGQLGSLSANTSVDAATLALGNDLLRWQELQPSRRHALARSLLSKLEGAQHGEPANPRLDQLDDAALLARLRTSLAGSAA